MKKTYLQKIAPVLPGIGLALVLALPAHLLGQKFPVFGSSIIAIALGVLVRLFYTPTQTFVPGLNFTSKYILQFAVILLGFGLNISQVFQTAGASLPILISTVLTALVVAYFMYRLLGTEKNSAILVGIGTAICGGSAIAASAPIIEADDEDVAGAISVIFLFNFLGAIIYPYLAIRLGFPTDTGEVFGLFAGTVINDTSSVTAAASTWDTMWGLGLETLDYAVMVKLTRTLAILPVTMGLAFWKARENITSLSNTDEKNPVKGNIIYRTVKLTPTFIILFIAASLATSIFGSLGIYPGLFASLKSYSKFFIVLAMASIGLKTDLLRLLKNSFKLILLGFICSISITLLCFILLKKFAYL